MTRYMIAFDDGDMVFPEEELPEAALAVVRQARAAGVWVFGAGPEHHHRCPRQVFGLLPDPAAG